jgi:trk system potassium uptake protein TrkH
MEVLMKSLRPAHALTVGYLAYIIFGALLLALPFSVLKDVSWLDHLFISASAVSTTGLATVDPGTSYTWFGQFVIMALIQLGGLGYMTASSFVILAANRKLSENRIAVLKGAFSLPKTIGIKQFVRNMFFFALICEIIGAAVLYPQLRDSALG